MKIIDFSRKGNVVRFYLGEKTADWGWTNKDYKYDGKVPDWLRPSDRFFGDDWDDTPYEHNAGTVYDEFIKGVKDIAFDYDDLVLEPADVSSLNSSYSKENMINREIPCIIVVPAKIIREKDLYYWQIDFEDALKMEDTIKYYFGDEL